MNKIAIGDILGARHGKCVMGCGFVGLLLGSGICITCKEDVDEAVEYESQCSYSNCKAELESEDELEQGLCEEHIQMIDEQELEDRKHPDQDSHQGKTINDPTR